MGRALLSDVLRMWDRYDLEDEIYIPSGTQPELNTEVTVFSFDQAPPRRAGAWQYLLGMEQVRDIILGLEQQIGRKASPEEQLAAVLHYAEYDAFIDPAALKH